MLLNPLSDRDSFGIDEAEEVAKTWWIFLVGGIVSLVFGALILAVDWGVDSLAAFIGVLFIIEGVAWAVTKPLDGGARWTNLIAGALAIAAGIALLVWPGRGLYTLADGLTASGLHQQRNAFDQRGRDRRRLLVAGVGQP